MKFRFSAFDPAKHGRKERFKRLRKVFDELLLHTGSDAELAMEWMDRLAKRYQWFDEAYSLEDFKKDLLSEGSVKIESDGSGGTRFTLTPKGEQNLRRDALERIFSDLSSSGNGDHRTRHGGGAGEESEETRPWTFGDPMDHIAWTPTIRNALLRSASDGDLSAWSLREEDFEVREKELSVACATVLLVDVSHSMILYGEDRMTPARQVALALFELITTRFRKDTLDLVLFGDDAEHVHPKNIPYIAAGPFHTNTKAGLQMAQEILQSRKNVNKQIFMITDGKPSALWKDGSLYKNPFGLDDEIRNRTLDEALRCRKSGIQVTTFMVAQDPILVDFVEEFSTLCRGKAYFTGTENLGAALFVDYMRNRRSRA